MVESREEEQLCFGYGLAGLEGQHRDAGAHFSCTIVNLHIECLYIHGREAKEHSGRTGEGMNWRRLKYLLPSRRRQEEREMQEELEMWRKWPIAGSLAT